MWKNILVVSSLLLASCSQTTEKRDLETVYIGSGVEQFTLADVPDWVQFSDVGRCYYKKNIRYVHYENLNKSYALTYEQLAQFQYLLNRKLASVPYIDTKEEEQIFYDTYEKIRGGNRAFLAPDFKRVNLIWIDDIINGTYSVEKLKNLLGQKEMEIGYPVLVSMCLSEKEMDEFLSENALVGITTKYISRELFSVFQADFKRAPGLTIQLDSLFGNNQKIYFYSLRENKEIAFKGYHFFKKY